MHILDYLEFLNDERNVMPLELCSELLHVNILTLKMNLPNNYHEAWNHLDPKFPQHWRMALMQELDSILMRKVWQLIKKARMAKNCRCIKSKWVFDIKRYGLFKVRLVACGYSQVPGVDFTES